MNKTDSEIHNFTPDYIAKNRKKMTGFVKFNELTFLEKLFLTHSRFIKFTKLL